MSAFTSTLRLVMGNAQLAALKEEELVRFYRNANVTGDLRFSSEDIVVIESGQALDTFQSAVLAVFGVDGVLYLKLGTGDVVALKYYSA